MIKYFDRLNVTDQQWRQYVDKQLADFQYSQTSDDLDATHHPAYQPSCDFLKTGEIAPLLHTAERDGFVVNWRMVAKTNPSREFDVYISNIQQYWAWLLEDKASRIPNQHMLEEPVEQSYFWQQMVFFSAQNDGIRDPAISQKLFNCIYGEAFQPDISYLISQANPEWQAERQLIPMVMFEVIMHQLNIYLFHEPVVEIGHAMPLVALEYWFSIIPHIKESYFIHSGYLSTSIRMEEYYDEELDDDEEELVRSQLRTREFFALLNDCIVGPGPDEPIHNDPEVAHYILQRFKQIDLPDEYHRFIEFLHANKGNLKASA